MNTPAPRKVSSAPAPTSSSPFADANQPGGATGAASQPAPPPSAPTPSVPQQPVAVAPSLPQHPPAPTEPEGKAPAASDGLPVEQRVRKPFGAQEARLPNHSRPGFRARIFNDVPGRIERAKEAGYAHVLDDKGQPKSVIVDAANGGGTRGYLMEIPVEFYDEDFAKKMATNDAIDQAMLGKAMQDGGYRPVVPGTNRPVTQANVIRGREPGRD